MVIKISYSGCILNFRPEKSDELYLGCEEKRGAKNCLWVFSPSSRVNCHLLDVETK